MSMMYEIAAPILTLVGVIITNVMSNNKSRALLEDREKNHEEKINAIERQISDLPVLVHKIDTLSERVEKHNQVIERTYKLEQHAGVLEEKINALEKARDK